MYFSYIYDYSYVHTFKDHIRPPANHAESKFITRGSQILSTVVTNKNRLFHFMSTKLYSFFFYMSFTAYKLHSAWEL